MTWLRPGVFSLPLPSRFPARAFPSQHERGLCRSGKHFFLFVGGADRQMKITSLFKGVLLALNVLLLFEVLPAAVADIETLSQNGSAFGERAWRPCAC